MLSHELGPRFDPSWEGRPPHMSSGDYPIWQRYLVSHKYEYLDFYYDVNLVPAYDLPVEHDELFLKIWRQNVAKRIDAVGVKKDGIYIIEVRVNAGAGALGAIQMYRDLWALNPPLSGKVHSLIISDYADQILPALALARDIEVVEA